MKIYPGGHIISTTEQITSNHIPISYFKKSDKGIIPSIIIEDEFCRSNTKDNVYPYQKFDKEVMFFDVDDNKIDNSSDYLVNRNDLYYYEPKDSVEFIPTEVTMSILLNRSDVYKSDVKYNINVGCYSEDIAESIIGLFNSKSALKPSNININNNAIVPFDLINSNNNNQDFIFINNEDVTSDVLEKFLNSNTNVWILNNEIDGLFCMQNENSNSKYTLSYSTVFSSKEHTINSYDNIVFSKQSTIEKLNEYEAINVFTSYMPIIIYKKPDNGFVIVSHTNIFKNVEESYKLIFEIIMSVYLNSYFRTKNKSFIITDNKIDYFITLNKKFNEYHQRINLNDMLFACKQNPNIESNIVSFDFGEEKINFIGINKQKDLFFRKAEKSDPDKKANSILIYTTNKTVLNYDFDKNVIKLIENKLIINHKQIEDKNYIIIDSFRSSKNRISLESPQSILIPDDRKYVVYYNNLLEEFDIVHSDNYDERIHGKKFATVKLDYDSNIDCCDMRIVGGGEDSKVVNYEMIDTGNINGRPYRVGSTMIIKLPKRFEMHKDKIISEVKKHMSSADYPILLFE